jgi:hypothetical protein
MNHKHNMTKVHYFLTNWQAETLRHISDKDGRPVSELIRTAVDMYIRAYSSKVEQIPFKDEVAGSTPSRHTDNSHISG